MIDADVMKALGPRGVHHQRRARGSVVDEPALVAALKIRKPFWPPDSMCSPTNPPLPDELKAMQNVVLLPHIGSASVVTRKRHGPAGGR